MLLKARVRMQNDDGQPSLGLVLAPAGPSKLVFASAAQVLVWSLDSQQVELILKADDDPEQRCAIRATSNGQVIAAGLVGKHPVVLVWEQALPDKPVARLKAHRFDVISLAFNAEGMEPSIPVACGLLPLAQLDMPEQANQLPTC